MEFEGNVLVVTENLTNFGQGWIFDSGCDYHICLNRDWFTTYEPVNGGFVLMGNNHPCKIIGVGSVRIKTHDGVVRTLVGVRHVPDMSKNLISLSTLEISGYSFVGGDGILDIIMDAVVVMRARRIGRLYELQGSTVTGTATLTSHSSILLGEVNFGDLLTKAF